MAERLDQPRETRRVLLPRPRVDADRQGQWSESIARFLGTPRFIIWLTLFCIVWIAWNTFSPVARFDKASNGFTALTLMLSLQASYAAPLILLAQNRQTDRDRVQAEQDRQRAERNLADTEFLAREMAALRIALSEVATRDFVRSELRNLLEELAEEREAEREEREREEREREEREREGREREGRDRDGDATA
ncbi:DUF1003 domain-containing protein [Cellulomonas fimi]|uniref:Integral membrane protein n=1 Tax=Cellulomonas fimi (strain ATCC 484 / DSM 20113 / JCM 1341 / CCUG 24087 / LMG 16345 / NBRC 15513 / NCIMB 8980 / NCTC 7547 / NRS-133) TaxID=590998 RepID=F4H368_CELFA|nr:DUF1003 domain-containing protein [Cellulomonas fimi]AEE45289.1 protein of unknown function DUF1003 [Cellulomonas fimi ATCC 484]NNH08034.1 DUF1003 domain-containing protein [Cellulomonas fimi]VEH28827.1 Predicted membrane protein [Cellulomonas fimi]